MSLRETALRGGAYLVVRELLGIVIRFGGVLAVTRLIGPSDFGLYAGSLALVTVLAIAAQLGAEVYLVRREHEPEAHEYDEVFTVLLVSTGVALALGLLASVAVGAVLDDRDLVLPFQVLLLALPLGVLWAPAQAILERSFRFRPMASLQLGSDAALYAVAVPLAFAGLGVWAPIAGTFGSYGVLLVLSFVIAPYRPRLRFSRARLVELGRYGASFTPAGLLARAELLVNPLIVGPFLGAASVGYVALAARLIDTVSFVLRSTYRVSLVALGRVQNDPERLRRGFEEMLRLQVLAFGPVLVVLVATSPWVIPLVFGSEWEPTLDVLPFFAAAALVLAIFNTHFAMLYVKERTIVTGAVALARVGILLAGAIVLVPVFGLVGFGVATLLTAAAWVIADREVRKVADFSYGLAPRWTVAFLPPLFIPLVEGPWRFLLLLSLLVVLLDREARRQVRGYASFLWSTKLSGRAGEAGR